MVVLGKGSSLTAAASRVISPAISGLISVVAELISSRHRYAAVPDHRARRAEETGATDSNRRAAAARPAVSAASAAATGHGTCISAYPASRIVVAQGSPAGSMNAPPRVKRRRSRGAVIIPAPCSTAAAYGPLPELISAS